MEKFIEVNTKKKATEIIEKARNENRKAYYDGPFYDFNLRSHYVIWYKAKEV